MRYDLVAIKRQWTVPRILAELHIDPGKNGRTKCPLCYHLQSTPSNTFSYGDIGWNCFRCGEHGDSISLYMKIHDIDFKTALSHLGKDHMTIIRYPVTTEEDFLVFFTSKDFSRERDDYIRLLRMIRRAELEEIMGCDDEVDLAFIYQKWDMATENLNEAYVSVLHDAHRMNNLMQFSPPGREGRERRRNDRQMSHRLRDHRNEDPIRRSQ